MPDNEELLMVERTRNVGNIVVSSTIL